MSCYTGSGLTCIEKDEEYGDVCIYLSDSCCFWTHRVTFWAGYPGLPPSIKHIRQEWFIPSLHALCIWGKFIICQLDKAFLTGEHKTRCTGLISVWLGKACVLFHWEINEIRINHILHCINLLWQINGVWKGLELTQCIKACCHIWRTPTWDIYILWLDAPLWNKGRFTRYFKTALIFVEICFSCTWQTDKRSYFK